MNGQMLQATELHKGIILHSMEGRGHFLGQLVRVEFLDVPLIQELKKGGAHRACLRSGLRY